MTAAQCKELASYYKVQSQAASISPSRASILKNIAKSFLGLATQLDRLAALVRDEAKSKQSR